MDPLTVVEAAFALFGEFEHGGFCIVCADVLGETSVSVGLMSGSNAGPVCSSDDFSGRLDELQFTLGEGPSLDAVAGAVPVSEPDLAGVGPGRWPAFSPPALALGLRAVFAFPLKKTGSSPFGSINLYLDRSGPLSDRQVTLAPVLIQRVSEKMLQMQRRSSPGSLPTELAEAADHRAEVHQAAGILAVQLGIAVEEGAIRLRAYAYSVDRPLADVATDVVMDRLRLPADPAPGGSA